MSALDNTLHFLLPYQWEPLITLTCGGLLLLYVGGLVRGAHPGPWRNIAFFLGLGLIYFVTQTRYDYFSQYVFFFHRGQHLVLHHLGAMLIALANPLPVLATGTPRGLRERVLAPAWNSGPIQLLYRFIQHPVIAGLLFVGLIYFWLIPAIHFDAMLSQSLYNVMNWSMAVDGVLFWWLILNPNPPATARGHAVGFGKRCLLLALVAFPQIILGAYITFAHTSLYSIYALCGRPWPIAAKTDQVIGGIITWIPSAMMSLVGVVIVMAKWRKSERPAAVAMAS